MATVYGQLGAEYTKVYGDLIYDEATLPNTTNASSVAFKLGGNNHRGQIVLNADTEITVAATKAITIELMHCDTIDGSYTSFKTLLSIAPSTIALGANILKYVAEDGVKHYAKIKITTTGDQSAGKITGFLAQVV